MWNRKEIKARGKDIFRLSYWKCVLVAAILAAAGAGGAASGSFSSVFNRSDNSGSSGSGSSGSLSSEQLAVIAAIIIIALIIAAIAFAVRVFALNPVIIGCRSYALETSRGSGSLKELGYGFKNGYWRVVKTMFFNDLFLMLWSLLFLVPGIIKSYSYRLVPYILAENPELSGTEVITRSRQMMNGHKWRTFVLDLSFILCDLLSVITCGVVGIFYVGPYKMQTDAELYRAIKAEN